MEIKELVLEIKELEESLKSKEMLLHALTHSADSDATKRMATKIFLHYSLMINDDIKEGNCGLPLNIIEKCCRVTINLIKEFVNDKSYYSLCFWENVQHIIDDKIQKEKQIYDKKINYPITKEFIEEAIKKADNVSVGEFACKLTNPNEADVLKVAVIDNIKEKYVVLLNEKTFNRVDLFIAQQGLLHRFELKICNEINPDNFLIVLGNDKFIYGNFTVCKTVLKYD